GFRYVNLSESLNIREDFTVLPGIVQLAPGNPAVARLVGSHIDVVDSFRTHNQFYGGQVGGTHHKHFGGWGLDFRRTVGLGDTRQAVDIGGSTVVTGGGIGNRSLSGGLLAVPTNIGHFSHDRFGVLPELGVTLGYQVNDHVRLFVGYNLLYWSSVVRPG